MSNLHVVEIEVESKMLEKILDKLGWVRKDKVAGFRDLSSNPFTEEELSFMLAGLLDDATEDLSDKVQEKMFTELQAITGLVDYLRRSANKDMVRYFGALTPQEQLIIRGAFARTNYLKSKIISGGKVSKPKIDGLRYAE